MCDLATGSSTEVYDLTDEILNYVAESRIRNGHLLIQPMHTTVGIYLNEGESRLFRDFVAGVEKRMSCSPNELVDCHSHLKSAFLSNPSLSLVIFGGVLQMGKYQRILFAEFDGPCPREHRSRRRYAVSIIGA